MFRLKNLEELLNFIEKNILMLNKQNQKVIYYIKPN